MCGNGLRGSARFCDACGSPVKSSLAERKQVTVLLADVVGSMNLAATLNPERLREIMHELFNRSAAVVQRYQGTLDKFTGDGLMAIFGAPVALEDHPLRACISALEIQSVAHNLAAEVLSRDNVELQIRIGLNSGEVIAGGVGVGPNSYTAVGHAVGMAQRMEGAADPGGILCTASTARLVEHSALLGPVEWVTIKGDREPVSARRLEGIESEHTVMGRDEGPLMGRDADLAALLDAFNDGQMSVAVLWVNLAWERAGSSVNSLPAQHIMEPRLWSRDVNRTPPMSHCVRCRECCVPCSASTDLTLQPPARTSRPSWRASSKRAPAIASSCSTYSGSATQVRQSKR